MKIRCLSGCLFFTMGFLAVSPAPAPAQETATAAAPAAEVGPGENDSRPPPQTDAGSQPADAARIAVLEARVATLESELRHLRAAMKSAGAALSAAAAGGEGEREGRLAAEARGSGNVPGANAPGSPQEPRNHFLSLSAAGRVQFMEELRARQHELSNASPEEREAMVREVMERARNAADGASSGSSTTNSANTSTNTSNSPVAGSDAPPPPPTTMDDARRMSITPPAATPRLDRDASAAPAPEVRSTVTSTDASRQRFEALNEEQRRRFMDEVRKNREKLTNATPAEREALTKEALTKVEKEKEAGKSAGGGGGGGGAAAAAASESKAPAKEKR